MAAKNPPKAAGKATDSSEPKAFDAKANAQKLAAEKAARAKGEKLEEKRFIVATGRSVRKGGDRYTQGEAIDLTAADAERLLHRGDVVEAKSKAAAAAKDAAGSEGDNAGGGEGAGE